jgi:chromosomal replication initiation ATPase DnaA
MDSHLRQLLRDLQRLIDTYAAIDQAVAEKRVPTPAFDRLGPDRKIQFIADYVAEHFGIPTSVLKTMPPSPATNKQRHTKKGPNRYAEVRFIAFRLANRLLDASTCEIARVFKKDHGTILYGLKRAQEMIDADPDYRDAYNFLEAELRQTLSPSSLNPQPSTLSC